MNFSSSDFSPENAKDCNQETLFGQHLLVCALQEMGLLMLSLGTTANNLITETSGSKYSFSDVEISLYHDFDFTFRNFFARFNRSSNGSSRASLLRCSSSRCLVSSLHLRRRS